MARENARWGYFRITCSGDAPRRRLRQLRECGVSVATDADFTLAKDKRIHGSSVSIPADLSDTQRTPCRLTVNPRLSVRARLPDPPAGLEPVTSATI